MYFYYDSLFGNVILEINLSTLLCAYVSEALSNDKYTTNFLKSQL